MVNFFGRDKLSDAAKAAQRLREAISSYQGNTKQRSASFLRDIGEEGRIPNVIPAYTPGQPLTARSSLLEAAAARFGGGDGEIPPESTTSTTTPMRRAEVVPKPTGLTKKSTDWKGILGAGLQGAAYGIQADVGQPMAGRSLAQGLMKGIVGMGLSRAAQAKIEKDAAERAQKMADERALIAYKEGFKPSLADEAKRAKAIAEATLPSKLAVARETNTLRDKFDIAKSERRQGMTDKELVDLNNIAADNVSQRFAAIARTTYTTPSEAEWQLEFIKEKARLLSGARIPKAPKLP